MEITHEKACHCALNRIFGFEPKIALALISHLGGAEEVFRLESKEIDSLLGSHSKYSGCISNNAVDKAYRELEELAAYAEQMGAPALPGSGKQEYLESVVNSVLFGC